LSPKKCEALAIRVGRVLRKDIRDTAAGIIAKIIGQEVLRRGRPLPDAEAIAEILAGERDPDWDAGPHESTPGMLLALRQALKAAAESEAGLKITWGDDEE
jgi:hypothetical protein